MSPTEEREVVSTQVEALSARLHEIDEDRAALRGKIDKAKTDRQTLGISADPDWLRRATGALRHLGVERNQVCQSLAYGNKRLRVLNDMLSRDLFKDAVREIVTEATWDVIIQRTQELRREAGVE